MNPFEDSTFRSNIRNSFIIDLIISNNDFNIKEFNIKKCRNNIIVYTLKCDKIKYEYKFMLDEYSVSESKAKSKSKNKSKNKLKINTSNISNNKNNRSSAMSEDF